MLDSVHAMLEQRRAVIAGKSQTYFISSRKIFYKLFCNQIDANDLLDDSDSDDDSDGWDDES